MRNVATCTCGQLKLSYDGEIVRTSICHCLACQKRTGSSFGIQTRLDRDKITIVGESKRFDRPTHVGDHVRFHFCPNCGSTVYWEVDDFPTSYTVAVGAFASAQIPAPVVSVFETRKHEWLDLTVPGMEHWD